MCLAKVIWSIFSGSDTLWIAWVKNILHKCFWTAHAYNYHSWSWKKILKIRPLFRTLISYEVGNGRDTFLCHDAWYPKGPLELSYGPSIVHCAGLPYDAKLSIVIVEWHWPPARIEALLEIQSLLCGVINPKDSDDKAS